MPDTLCQQCRQPGRLLDAISKQAYVDYYRCDACGAVWTHQKHDTASPPTPITVHESVRL